MQRPTRRLAILSLGRIAQNACKPKWKMKRNEIAKEVFFFSLFYTLSSRATEPEVHSTAGLLCLRRTVWHQLCVESSTRAFVVELRDRDVTAGEHRGYG